VALSYVTMISSKSTAGSIAAWVNDDNVVAQAADMVSDAEQAIYQRLRVREMLTSVTGTITASASTLTLPSDYRQSRFLRITGTDAALVDRKTLEEVQAAKSYDGSGSLSTGKPTIWHAAGTTLYFAVRADKAYPYELWYYRELPALSTATATNFLTNKYPRLLRCMCLAYANEFKKHESEVVRWTQLASAEIQAANVESDAELAGTQFAVSAE